MRHRLSRAADHDLERIYRASLLRFGRAQADRYMDGLQSKFDQLERTPEIAPIRSDLGGVRMLRYESHNIFYHIGERELLIVRVLHGRQDSRRYLRHLR